MIGVSPSCVAVMRLQSSSVSSYSECCHAADKCRPDFCRGTAAPKLCWELKFTTPIESADVTG